MAFGLVARLGMFVCVIGMLLSLVSQQWGTAALLFVAGSACTGVASHFGTYRA